MGFGVSLITFSPNSTIKSADVNSNFANLNNATDFQGNWDTGTSGVALWVSDEVVDSNNTIHIKPITASPQRTVTLGSRSGDGAFHGGLYITAGASSGGDTVILQNLVLRGNVTFASGAISRQSSFTGTGTGTFNHGLGTGPSIAIVQYAGNFTPGSPTSYYNATSTQVTINAAAGLGWTCWCFHN